MKLASICFVLSAAALSCASYGWRDGVVEEAFPATASLDSDWWVNSGAYFFKESGVGHTILGELDPENKWQKLYATSNPKDTDGGTHPQNIFRLISRKMWDDNTQSVLFYVDKTNLSESENRNESNAVLLFSRYRDENNLYYSGLRVDGHPVIKKKSNGVYYTLAYPEALYPGTYNKTSNPNLLPSHKWIGIQSRIRNLSDGSVQIQLYVSKEADGQWVLAVEAFDDGSQGGPPLRDVASNGIRTDFMDVKFRSYEVSPLRDIHPTKKK